MKEDSVSSTAFSVAQGVLFTASKKNVGSLVSGKEKIFYEIILKSTGEGRKKWKQLQSPVFRFMVPFIEKLMVPGLSVHYALRKKAIENFTREAIKKGAGQIVNLGAGFDSLAYRIAAELPEINAIEIDHPATHRVKKEAFMAMGNVPGNLHLLDIDFNKDSLEKKLSGFKHFKPNTPTVFIIEGVLMYLGEDKVADLFQSIKNIAGKGFRLVFTFITPDGEGRHTHGPLLGIYLKIKNEPLNWKISADALKTFMDNNDIPLVSIARSEDILHKQIPGANITVHDGELIACADYKLKK